MKTKTEEDEGRGETYCAGSTVVGSMVLPERRTSKCRRGLGAPPDSPALAMTWPYLTVSPFFTDADSLLP